MARELLLNTPGKRLRALRISVGYSQRDLAEKLGVTQSYLSRIERGNNMINSVVVPLAEILNVSTDYLLMQTDELQGEAGEGSSTAEDAQEDFNMRILRMAIGDMSEAERPDLLRFLIRQVGVYRDTFGKK